MVSLGFDADGKRIRKKVSGKSRTEVKDKLKEVHSELAAGVRTAHGYTVEKAVAHWLDEGLPGRTVKTVEVNRESATHATRTLQKSHNCLTRAVRHAEGQNLVRRNVPALVDTPQGREGRQSESLTLEQASALLEAAEKSRLHAFIVLCLLTGVRSEEARALTWTHADLDAGTIMVWRSVRAHGDTKTVRSRRTLNLPEIAVEALRGHKRRQADECARAGDAWHEHGLVFTTSVPPRSEPGGRRDLPELPPQVMRFKRRAQRCSWSGTGFRSPRPRSCAG